MKKIMFAALIIGSAMAQADTANVPWNKNPFVDTSKVSCVETINGYTCQKIGSVPQTIVQESDVANVPWYDNPNVVGNLMLIVPLLMVLVGFVHHDPDNHPASPRYFDYYKNLKNRR